MSDRVSFDQKKYYIHLDPKPNALLVSSRGCPFQCTYCIWPQAMNGNVYRSRSAKNIADEVEQLIESGIIFYRFDDDIFSLNQKLTIEFCEEIIKEEFIKKQNGHVLGMSMFLMKKCIS